MIILKYKNDGEQRAHRHKSFVNRQLYLAAL